MQVRDLITTALRRIKVIASGETPTADEMNDGLVRLQALVLEHPGLVGASWRDRYAKADGEIPTKDGDRLFANGFAVTAVLPVLRDGWCGPRDVPLLSRVCVMQPSGREIHIYATDWRRADALTLDSPNPFGDDTDSGLVSQLAVALAPEYGEDPAERIAFEAARSEKAIRSRLYRAPETCRLPDDYL